MDTGNLRHGFQSGADILCGAFDGQVHSPGSGHLPLQVFRGVAGDQLAAVDDKDVIADRADLGQDVGAEDDRVLFAQATDHIPDLDDLFGVQTHGGFIQNDHLGLS